ncbi:hypothetical protein [Paraburkholderia sartisoli]|nr:hypothetical protein [Paraburkholderia sartisoli]
MNRTGMAAAATNAMSMPDSALTGEADQTLDAIAIEGKKQSIG